MRQVYFGLVALLLVGGTDGVSADDKIQKVSLAGGKFAMSASGDWTKKTPRVNIIEAEFWIDRWRIIKVQIRYEYAVIMMI